MNPLQLDIKFDKKGLMAAEEEGRKAGRAGAVATMTACKDLAGKHPVSALTELCSKRRSGLVLVLVLGMVLILVLVLGMVLELVLGMVLVLVLVLVLCWCRVW